MGRPKKEDREVPEDETTVPDEPAVEALSSDDDTPEVPAEVVKLETELQERTDKIEDKGYIGSHPEDLKDGDK